MSYCNQCFNSIKGDCPHEYCERRLQETGDARKKASCLKSDGYCIRCAAWAIIGCPLCNYMIKKETQMTRQEAIKKMSDNGVQVVGESVIIALEALGLIKFEEEKKETFWIGDIKGCNNEHSMKMIKAAMNASGYEIVKLDVNTTVTIEACVEMPSMSSERHINGKLLSIKQ